jgi:hypothetical protein
MMKSTINKTKVWRGKRYQYDSKHPNKRQAAIRADQLEGGIGLIGHHKTLIDDVTVNGILWFVVYKRKYSPNR